MALTTTANLILTRAGVPGEGTQAPEQYWEVVERYRGELLNQAVAILGSIDDAEDVVQETFCEAMRSVAALGQARSIGAWLRAVNRNNALDAKRKKNCRSEHSERQLQQANRTTTTGGFSAFESHELIAKAIDVLPANMRAVIVLHYWEHLSCEQIAARLKTPSGTVKWLLVEATVRLHSKLKILDDRERADGPKK